MAAGIFRVQKWPLWRVYIIIVHLLLSTVIYTGLWPKTASLAALCCQQSPFWGCMSVHNHFGAVIAKVSVTIGQNCLWVEVIGVSVICGDSCSGIEDIDSKTSF